MTRNAALLCLLMMTAATPAPVELTSDEAAVLAVALNRRFPDHSRTLLVADMLPKATGDATGAVQSRNGEVRSLARLDLGRPTRIVSKAWLTNAASGPRPFADAAGVAILTQPVIEGDAASLEYQVLLQGASGLEVGHCDVVLARSAGGWSIVREQYVRDLPPPPPDTPMLRVAPPPAPPRDMDGPFRVGGDVKAPILEYRVEPVRTPEAVAHDITGIVILEIVVDKSGKVTDAQVLKPLPFGLDKAAVDAVKQWRYRPGTLAGQPVAVIYNITVNFKDGDDQD